MNVIAGDEFALSVEFFGEAGQYKLRPKDTSELVIYAGHREFVFKAIEYVGNAAKFYLSGKDTRELYKCGFDSNLFFSVRIYFNGDPLRRLTPIYREELRVDV